MHLHQAPGHRDARPVCGQTMFKKSGKGFKKPVCINEKCSNFTPEEKRGGYRKKAAEDTGNPEAAAETAPEGEAKAAAKKPAAKKTAAKSPAKSAAKKPAAKKTAAKSAAKKAETDAGE